MGRIEKLDALLGNDGRRHPDYGDFGKPSCAEPLSLREAVNVFPVGYVPAKKERVWL
jgi:hypothetical protein